MIWGYPREVQQEGVDIYLPNPYKVIVHYHNGTWCTGCKLPALFKIKIYISVRERDALNWAFHTSNIHGTAAVYLHHVGKGSQSAE